jgi:branched-chain amino acid transport system substrate-binding protein
MKRCAALALVLAGWLAACLFAGTVHAQGTGGVIRVGLLYDLSGPLANSGSEAGFLGSRIAIDMANERGGVGGLRVQAVRADARSSPATALMEMERLIGQEQVEVIVGGYANAQCLPLAARMEAAGKVFWATLCADPGVLEGRRYRYVFRGAPDYAQIGAASCDFLAAVAQPKLGIAPRQLRVAIIHESGAFGAGVAAANRGACARHGMRVVLKQAYEASTPDLADLIVELRRVRPDVVLHTGYHPDVTLFLRNALEQNFKLKALIGHGGGYAELDRLAASFGADLNYIFNVGVPAARSFLELDDAARRLEPGQEVLLAEMRRRYQALKGPGEMPPQAGLAFSQTWVLLTDVLPRALRKYGGVHAAAIRQAALDTDLPPGGAPLGQGVKFAPPASPMAGQNQRAVPAVMQHVNKRSYIAWPPALASTDVVMPFPPGHVFAP